MCACVIYVYTRDGWVSPKTMGNFLVKPPYIVGGFCVTARESYSRACYLNLQKTGPGFLEMEKNCSFL